MSTTEKQAEKKIESCSTGSSCSTTKKEGQVIQRPIEEKKEECREADKSSCCG